MSTEKIPCKNENCNRVILEITANKNGGYCYPCFNQKKALEWEEYVRTNRKEVNLYKGITDSVEIIKIMFAKKVRGPLIIYTPYDKTKEEVFSLLVAEDIERLMKYVMSLYLEDDDNWQYILLNIVSFCEVNIDGFLERIVKDNHYYPSEIFIGASEKIASMLIEKLYIEENSLEVNRILSALAWCGNKIAIEEFKKLKDSKSKINNNLNILAYEYTKVAGYILNNEGDKENLYLDKSFKAKEGKSEDKDYVKFLSRHDEKCQWCGRGLMAMITINLENEKMNFIGLKGKELKIVACDSCNCYGPIYMDVDFDGNSKWSKYNNKPEYLPDEDEIEEMVYDKEICIKDEEISVKYGLSWFLECSYTKIGGVPTWIQSSGYEVCPNCKEEMKFIGQVSNEDVMEYGEGMFYGFLCDRCKVTTVSYQQS